MRIKLNLRRSKGDRASVNSYSNYHHRIKKMILNVIPFKKRGGNSKIVNS